MELDRLEETISQSNISHDRRFTVSYSGSFSKNDLHSKSCIIPICIEDSEFEKDSYAQYLIIIQDTLENFKTCTVVICDTLHRHNEKIKLQSPDLNLQIEQKTKHLGSLFEKKMSAFFKGRLQKPNIKYWDEYLQDQNYSIYLEQIRNFHEHSQEFQKIVVRESHAKVGSYISKHVESDIIDPQAIAHSISYIFEESAIYLIWANTFDYVVHDKKISEPLKFIEKKIIRDKNKSTLLEYLVAKCIKLTKKAESGGTVSLARTKSAELNNLPSINNSHAFFSSSPPREQNSKLVDSLRGITLGIIEANISTQDKEYFLTRLVAFVKGDEQTENDSFTKAQP